ncbi:MAG TPA: hypothetical protein VGM03_13760 [Phycisphaerae bacterium]|jgi:hypothetical protein
MSQFNPPSPPAAGPPVVGPGYLPTDGYQRPPLSVAAVVGFVSSLLFCIPVVAPLVGIISGLVGVFTTAGGKRRGQWMAIAAIPIALLVGAGQGAVGYLGVRMFVQSFQAERRYVRPLFESGGDTAAKVANLYPHTSRRFQQRISQEQLAAWVEQVRAKHGTLQSARPTEQPLTSDAQGRMVISIAGSFSKGSAPYSIALLPQLHIVIDDITVDGQSPLSSP